MKNGNFAIYRGKEYSADYVDDKTIVLRSEDIKDLENGFQKYEGYNKEIVCVKYVARTDLTEFYQIRTKAIYHGLQFEVFEEKDNMISIIGFLGNYREFLKLGMQCIDKGVYQKWIRKDEAEIKIVKEER